MKKKVFQYCIAAVLLFSSVNIASALDIGTQAPDFTLSTVDGKEVSLSDYKEKIVVLEWFNKGCPFVVKFYDKGEMQKYHSDAKSKDIVWLVINSTSSSHKDYLDEENTRKVIEEWKITDADYLLDTDGKVGKLYSAKTTPHMFIINKGELVYQGAIDDNSDAFADPTKAKNYVRVALDEIAAGKPVSQKETKPYGCSVKY